MKVGNFLIAHWSSRTKSQPPNDPAMEFRGDRGRAFRLLDEKRPCLFRFSNPDNGWFGKFDCLGTWLGYRRGESTAQDWKYRGRCARMLAGFGKLKIQFAKSRGTGRSKISAREKLGIRSVVGCARRINWKLGDFNIEKSRNSEDPGNSGI